MLGALDEMGAAMSLPWRRLIASIAFAAVCAGVGVAQQAASEKSAAQIKVEQTPQSIAATPLCQWAVKEVAKGEPMVVWPDGKPVVNQRQHSRPDSDLLDLKSLFEASDEVIFAVTGPFAETVAPSGTSAITYNDVQVLRSWKGEHKAGDFLTYTIPVGTANCPATRVWSLAGYEWGGGSFLSVLFLRDSKDAEAQTTPGLRLTGGNGLQGAILLPYRTPMSATPWACKSFIAFNPWNKDYMGHEIQKCNDFIDKSTDPIGFQSPKDPLAARYYKMPISDPSRDEVAGGQCCDGQRRSSEDTGADTLAMVRGVATVGYASLRTKFGGLSTSLRFGRDDEAYWDL